jgi:hypothetical protein
VSADDNFLSRWSRRKTASKAGPTAPLADAVPVQAGIQVPQAKVQPAEAPTPLPSIESLTPESDFTPFMQADVDPGLKREALKVLVRDPRFNVMDGLDVYIDDYSKPDPLPPEWLGQLNMMKRLGAYVEETAEEILEPDTELQKALPDDVPPAVAEAHPPATAEDSAANIDVTASRMAGGKLPRNEA